MSFTSFCVWSTAHAAARADLLFATLQRRRIVRERRAAYWRLWPVHD